MCSWCACTCRTMAARLARPLPALPARDRARLRVRPGPAPGGRGAGRAPRRHDVPGPAQARAAGPHRGERRPLRAGTPLEALLPDRDRPAVPERPAHRTVRLPRPYGPGRPGRPGASPRRPGGPGARAGGLRPPRPRPAGPIPPPGSTDEFRSTGAPERTWLRAFAAALDDLGLAPARIDRLVARTAAHLQEAGAEPGEFLGPPTAYARSVVEALAVPPPETESPRGRGPAPDRSCWSCGACTRGTGTARSCRGRT